LLRQFVILALVLAVALSVPQLADLVVHASKPYQYGSVDIYTNRGGQGPNQYGGSFTVGETIIVYVYSSFSGIGTITDYEPDGSTYYVGPFNIYAGQILSIESTASNPPGKSTLTLQVCTGTQPPATPTTTFYMSRGEYQGAEDQAAHPQSSCASDTTWIDVVGGPADINVARCWVSPANPLQEDQVTFYAAVGNSGGTNAENVEIDAYLDGVLFSTERDSLSAGSSGTWYTNNKWTAEDGQHTLKVVANADHLIQESNYANNEASCTFYVRPHTITMTMTQTTSSTIIRSQWTTTSSTIQLYTTQITTSQTTVWSTVIGNPTWTTTTLTGLTSTTIYSPTITSTVTAAAQAISNPLALMFLFGVVIAIGGAQKAVDADDQDD
jgi:hypothetical protein